MSEHTCEACNYAETRTPTDMETAMSDIENASYEMSGGIAVFVASTTSDPIWAGDLLKAYQALSALGDPVVVAEALPELVEACGGLHAAAVRALPVLNKPWSDDVATECSRVRDAIAKLKARP